MRKLFALLMVACMLLGLVACASEPASDTTDTPATDTPATDTPATDTPAETPAKPVENKIIYGATTELGGDFGFSLWTNGATDAMVWRMTTEYNPVTTDQNGAYVINPTVAKNIESTEMRTAPRPSPSPSTTTWSSLTATPSLPRTLLLTVCSPAPRLPLTWRSAPAPTSTMSAVQSTTTARLDTFTGLRLIDEYTWSITVRADKLPYFYEDTFISAYPWHIETWFGEGADVLDDGNGCYFAINGDAAAFTADAVRDSVMACRNMVDSSVPTAGPYNLQSYDKSAKQATLVINENYAGNFEGQKPSIETIVIVKAEEETWADAIRTGEFNFYDTITDGEEINTALDIIENEGGFEYVQFDRAGYGIIQFMCDFGPTQSSKFVMPSPTCSTATPLQTPSARAGALLFTVPTASPIGSIRTPRSSWLTT